MLFTVLATVVVAVAWLFALAIRSITAPLSSSVDAIQRLAAGDLGAHIQVAGRDEISAMSAALRDMQTNLAQVVANVRQGSESVATASAEIAQGNQDLSARTESQASALEQTASSMEELSATV